MQGRDIVSNWKAHIFDPDFFLEVQGLTERYVLLIGRKHDKNKSYNRMSSHFDTKNEKHLFGQGSNRANY